MKKLFIWGQSGFIGKLLKEYFYKNSLDVSMIGRNKDCHFTINLASNTDIPNSIDNNSIVFFLSAISSPDVCDNDSIYAKKINLTNTSKIIKKLVNTGAKVIFFSTDMIYGNRTKACDETTSPTPDTNYALWKYLIEKDFYEYDNFITLRLSYLCDRNDKFTSFLINNAKGQTIEIFDPFHRSMIHSDDFLKIIDLCVKDDPNMPKILNVCGQECVSRVEYIKSFSDYINLRWKPIVMPDDFRKNRPESIIMKSIHIQNLISFSWTNPGDGILNQLKND
tara:strand:+ start:657 stop:1493 length:837 start_codon:yes stop_codon:yes gene_type:complete